MDSIITWIYKFYRTVPDTHDNINIPLFLVSVIIAILIAYKYRHNKILINISLIAGILIQVIMFQWYMMFPKPDWTVALPLYYCRIASYVTPIAYWAKKKNVAKFFAWVGLIGATMSIMFPDPEKFLWPHVTNLTFVGSHLCLAINGLFIISNINVRLKIKDVLFYTLIMNGVVSVANVILDSNYSYLRGLPFSIGFKPGNILLFVSFTILLTLGIMIFDWLDFYIRKSKNVCKDSLIA